MKTLSIKQPWAGLIINGVKDIENRTWQTKYRGKILVHACGTKKQFKYSDFLTQDQLLSVCDFLVRGDYYPREFHIDYSHEFHIDYYMNFLQNYQCTVKVIGQILGTVEIVDCVRNHSSVWAETGCWNWVLANPTVFKNPIENVKGKLSLWDYDGYNE
jgi:hypothetical protein